MEPLHRKHHWLGRLLASDPGLVRFDKAGRAISSLIVALFTTMLVLNELLPGIVAGLVGMMGIMMVLDEPRKKKQLTVLLLGVSAMGGVTLGSLLAASTVTIATLLVLLVFSSFYFTRFGVRYFSLSMIGFMTVYLSSFLNLASSQLPLFYLGILIGTATTYVFNFVLFQATAKKLKRSIRSFHIQSNLTFNLLIKGMKEKELSEKERKELRGNVQKLKDYAIIVSGYMNEADIEEMWPGLKSAQLRLYVFDIGMLIETLADSIQSLKKADALEIDELRRLLIWVTESLRDAVVLTEKHQNQNIEDAELAVQALRLLIIDEFDRNEQTPGWLFLIRRIESMFNHVIEGALKIQQARTEGASELDEDKEKDPDKDEEVEEADEKEDKGLKPSTKKAYQALVAGVIAVFVGHLISPIQPYWVLLTAFLVLLGTESIGRIYSKGFQRSVGTIIGAVIGFSLARLLTGWTILEVSLIFVALFFAFYLTTVSYTIMNVFITMLIAFMYDFLLGGITFSLIAARVVDTIAGAAIAFGVSMFIFPKRTKDKVAESIKDYLTELSPYVTEYVKRFREDVDVKALSAGALTLDQKLQTIKVEAGNRTGASSRKEINQWLTVFTAINYYARHLVASSDRKEFDYPDELVDVFIQIEAKLEQNIDALIKLMEGSERYVTLDQLEVERQQIEKLAPSHHDLIHHLYYVWRINKSMVELGASYHE